MEETRSEMMIAILELQKLMEEYREGMKEFREEVKEFREQWKSQADSTGDGTDEDEDLTVLDDGAEEAYYHVDVPHSSALEHSDNGDPDDYFICDDSDVPAGSEFSEDDNGSNAEIDETDVVVLKEALESADHKNRIIPVSALELFDESSKKEELKVEKLDIGLDIDEVVFAIGPWIKLVCLELHNSEATTVREVNDVHDSFDAMKLQETFLRGIYAYGLEKPSVVKMFDPSHDWGGVDQAASELIKTDVEPILEQYRPMISSMNYKLTLGTVAMMEMEMQWDGTRVSVALPVQVNNIGDRPQICNLYVFDLNDLMWSVVSVTGDIPPPRVSVTMASIGDIYVFGGRDSTYKELNELYSFNTCTSKWTLLSSGVTGPAHRSYHSITSDVHSINFDDRNVYIFGGCGNNGLAVAQGIG